MAVAAMVAIGAGEAAAEPPDHEPVAVSAKSRAGSSSSHGTYSCGGGTVAKFHYNRAGVTVNGTVTCLPEGAITAAHVVDRVAGSYRRPTRHDMVWLQRRQALGPQQPLAPGDRVTIVGYAESDRARPQQRTGRVLRAWKPGEWLVTLDEGQSPTRNGMSGGAVVDAEGRVRGIVITRNRKVDLDGDGQREHSSVVVDLAAWNSAEN